MTAACIEIGRSPGVTSKPSVINPVHMSHLTASNSRPSIALPSPFCLWKHRKRVAFHTAAWTMAVPDSMHHQSSGANHKLFRWSVCRLTLAL